MALATPKTVKPVSMLRRSPKPSADKPTAKAKVMPANLLAQTIEAAQRGVGEGRLRPFIVVAPTAAGKSLCFVLPMLRALLLDPFATALLLYPTKALAADQLASVRRALAAAGLAYAWSKRANQRTETGT